MNLKKSITWAVTGLFIFASALQAEEIKGDKTAGKTDARRLAKSGMADDGPTSTFFNINMRTVNRNNCSIILFPTFFHSTFKIFLLKVKKI